MDIYFYFMIYSLLITIILLLKSFVFWPLGTVQVDSWILLRGSWVFVFLCVWVYFSRTFLFSGTIRCYRLILSFPCPITGINYFKESPYLQLHTSGEWYLETKILSYELIKNYAYKFILHTIHFLSLFPPCLLYQLRIILCRWGNVFVFSTIWKFGTYNKSKSKM